MKIWFVTDWNSTECFFIDYLWLGMTVYFFWLVGFYGISTIVGYLMTIPLYTYILNIYDS